MANPSKKKNKRLNEQVKRNKERFPDDFMFQLTHEEWNVLQSQFATTKDLSKIRTLPYVFTRKKQHRFVQTSIPSGTAPTGDG